MKADLISLQAVIIGMAILLTYFGLRWFAARRPKCRRMAKAAPAERLAEAPEVHTLTKP